MSKLADIRIGISGWTYKPWRGHFYPKGLVQRRELAYASRAFRVIEVNGTFYGLQKPASYARWAEETPDDFTFTLKAPRAITHENRLKDPAELLANFLASGPLRLAGKLGPILWQFPPSFRFDSERMAAFFQMLPRDTEEASHAAGKSSLKDVWLKTDRHRRLRHAIEIRHESFRDASFIDLLKKHELALVLADRVEWPRLMDLTSDFIYCRLHGRTELYRSGYETKDLDRWEERVAAWAGGEEMTDGDFIGGGLSPAKRPVFLFFDNTDKLHAPDNARVLMARMHERGGPPVPGLPAWE
ncbi:DUF72 domain-containing protein [Lacibacterium aquatile]|uniref:DUF72 domain-containing protein n=1 Tax=Lacibacterium aquatile TaxID=1168082 RepID=A0ABW5DXP8_9PROT